MRIPVGTHLGPYEVVSSIGAGGMGEVYRATDSRLHRDVAIKVCAQRFGERFETEARAIAALNHPNICTLHDVGPDYLVMELVEGPTLAERIQQGALPLDEALGIARQVADALEAAHEKGIVHRDLKPGNIKIKPDGTVKVLDFGLAKMGATPTSRSDDSPTISIGVTQAGVIMGTAGYMSPEQARGKPVDKRADIWAFGVVLYEMLTGKTLFGGETLTDTLAAVVREEPRWELIPVKARRLVRTCLEKDPKQRLRDIGDAPKFLDEATPPAAPAVSRQPRLAWGLAIVFLLAAAAATIALFRQSPPAAPPVLRFQIAPPAKTSYEIYLALSPDGRRLAFTASGEDGRIRLWVRDLDSLDAKPLAGTEGPGSVFWSPDGRFLAFGDGNRLKKIDVSGGPPQTLCESPNPVGSGAWFPSGVILFGGRGVGPIMQVSAAGGAPAVLTALNVSRQETFHSFPSALPDGRHFIYYRNSPMADQAGVYVGSLDDKPDGQSSKRLMPSRHGAVYAATPGFGDTEAPKGRILFVRDNSLMAQPFDDRKLELTGDPVPVAEQVASTNQYPHVTASQTGILAYKTGGGSSGISQLTWFDRQGKSLGTVGESGEYGMVALSPDAARVAFSRSSPQAGGIALWLYEFSRGTGSRFTFDATVDAMPVWSPDGGRILFSSLRGGQYDLYQKASNGAGGEELFFQSRETKYAYDWSADGRFLLYSVVDVSTTKSSVWVLPLTGDRKPIPYLQSRFNQHQARFSHDGRWVAYTSNESGRNEVYVQPFPDPSRGKWMISREGGTQPRWRRDGKELFFLSFDSRIMAVDVSSGTGIQAGVPKALFRVAILGGNAIGNQHRYDVTADGKRFLVNTVTGSGPTSAITVVLNWAAATGRSH